MGKDAGQETESLTDLTDGGSGASGVQRCDQGPYAPDGPDGEGPVADTDPVQQVLLRYPGGARIPGGCDRCDSYQTVAITDYGANITVHHDDVCPDYRATSG